MIYFLISGERSSPNPHNIQRASTPHARGGPPPRARAARVVGGAEAGGTPAARSPRAPARRAAPAAARVHARHARQGE